MGTWLFYKENKVIKTEVNITLATSKSNIVLVGMYW